MKCPAGTVVCRAFWLNRNKYERSMKTISKGLPIEAEQSDDDTENGTVT